MRIAYQDLPERLASRRLRGLIPADELARLGHEIVANNADWLIISKRGPKELTIKARRICYDVCDDHFDHETLGDDYRYWLGRADLITCNTKAMAERIKSLGKTAVVIDDPYESPEMPPRCHEPCLWFGQKANLKYLDPIVERLPTLIVVSDAKKESIVPWTPENMRAAFAKAGIVVIPTGDRITKSANRAVESIRNGLYPVCGPLPAYEELGLGEDDIPAAVADALAHPERTKARVRELQDMIRVRFNPRTVGKAWERALEA